MRTLPERNADVLVKMDERCREFARTGVGVAHRPCSSMRLASGIAPVKKYLADGVRTDFFSMGPNTVDMDPVIEELASLQLTRAS